MNRFQRWLLKDMVFRFADEVGGAEAVAEEIKFDRRFTNGITKKEIEAKTNGSTAKQLIAEGNLENEKAHGAIMIILTKQGTTLNFHDRVIWWGLKTIIGTIIIGFISLGYWVIRYKIIGG